jgi:hypothetical protein
MTQEGLQRYTVAWQTGDGRWRWAYVEESPDRREVELVSHKEFLSRAEAERSAAVAYPDVLVRQPADPSSARGRARLVVLLTLVGLCLAVALAPRRPHQHDDRRSA